MTATPARIGPDVAQLREHIAAHDASERAAADEHREALRTARSYCNKLTETVLTPAAYDYATEAREIAEAFMNAELPAVRLGIARSLARHLVMAAFLADHLERLEGRE